MYQAESEVREVQARISSWLKQWSVAPASGQIGLVNPEIAHHQAQIAAPTTPTPSQKTKCRQSLAMRPLACRRGKNPRGTHTCDPHTWHSYRDENAARLRGTYTAGISQ